MANKNFEVLTLEGTYMFPRHEEGMYTACLLMDEANIDKLGAAVKKVSDGIGDGKEHTIKLSELKDYEGLGLNLKSQKDRKVYDVKGNELDLKLDEVPYESKVACSVNITEYSYRGKTGVTAYINGIVVLEMSEFKHRNLYEEIMNGRK